MLVLMLKRAMLMSLLIVVPLTLGSVPEVFGYGAGFNPPPPPEGTKAAGPSLKGTLTWVVTAGQPDDITFSGKCQGSDTFTWDVNFNDNTSDAEKFSADPPEAIEAFLEGTCEACNPFVIPQSAFHPTVAQCIADTATKDVFGLLLTTANTMSKTSNMWVGSIAFKTLYSQTP